MSAAFNTFMALQSVIWRFIITVQMIYVHGKVGNMTICKCASALSEIGYFWIKIENSLILKGRNAIGMMRNGWIRVAIVEMMFRGVSRRLLQLKYTFKYLGVVQPKPIKLRYIKEAKN